MVLCLAGKILSLDLINRDEFRSLIARIWRVQGDVEIEVISSNIYAFHFQCLDDRRKVVVEIDKPLRRKNDKGKKVDSREEEDTGTMSEKCKNPTRKGVDLPVGTGVKIHSWARPDDIVLHNDVVNGLPMVGSVKGQYVGADEVRISQGSGRPVRGNTSTHILLSNEEIGLTKDSGVLKMVIPRNLLLMHLTQSVMNIYRSVGCHRPAGCKKLYSLKHLWGEESAGIRRIIGFEEVLQSECSVSHGNKGGSWADGAVSGYWVFLASWWLRIMVEAVGYACFG
ncbi:hypothetical protein Ddye_020330 [Dipteronia dyeriana]|uniref:DUF4283 domain-containing protein n=1 Tax=Dipteronia dyeriana TaxID=168575 RepID=A0AAD9WWY3_9ROSI|nr:hypothetical protein Ddye_020330 [Dipteronia dyeriana]